MARSPLTTSLPWHIEYSAIIDVRSPTEYATDHIPGAVNLPVLNDSERVEVGTIYKQRSPFAASKRGAALISRNIAFFLETYFRDRDKDFHPLLYCWRGGKRSTSLAIVLSQIGWTVTILEGGYRTYRRFVRDRLQTLPQHFQFCVLCGMTGTGKTRILQALAAAGSQVLDLEAIAQHRGSLLGQLWANAPDQVAERPTPQPSQKYFETCLLAQLETLTPERPIWVESESHKIGKIYLPMSLWQQIQSARGVEIIVPLAQRVEGLLRDYPHLMAHPEFLKSKLQRLRGRYSNDTVDQWEKWIDTAQWEALVSTLLETHYDPAYRRSLPRLFPHLNGPPLRLENWQAGAIAAVVEQLQKFERSGLQI